ncbi:plasmid replication/partition related protein [Aquabacterium sp.]|uniref:plasmid replication/partition related protein n=1 Tax=Aquabacterium sp. TaxID=1872578 RepID=UPI002E2F8466|nr:plasmid replication/partition related protein [Aquabacterium sp.]HEX5312131.1 plasmid replication/partition related protein [Aquabacterium sp.]
MNIVVKEELRVYIDPLTPEEHEALERSILSEGCRDALVLWGDVLVDGHNRYGICMKHGIPFQTVQNPRFQSMEDVHLWMIDQHLGRRSVSDFQRGVLALRKKEILAARQQARVATADPAQPESAPAEGQAPWEGETDPKVAAALATLPAPDPLASREAIARAARISSTTVSQIEKIQKAAAPELVEAVKAGVISINAAAAVASLPVEEQVAAVAGGKKELQQAARQVRESKSRQRAASANEATSEAASGDELAATLSPQQELDSLRERVRALEAENAELRARLQALEAQP